MQSSVRLKEPRRKRARTQAAHQEPLPVSLQCSQASAFNNWKVCKGLYDGGSVLVHDLDEIEFIYINGFFGKGAHSRGPPELLAEYLEADERFLIPCKKKRNDIEDDGLPPLPFPTLPSSDVHEPLVLSLCEAFFLTYGLGCLVIYDDQKKPMSILRTWRLFMNFDPNFVVTYAAYHYLRSKGWVVRSGVKYGSNFVLYKDGPAFYHSTYSVVVKPVLHNSNDNIIHVGNSNNNNSNNNNNNDNNNYHMNSNNNVDGDDDDPCAISDWTSLSRLNRITEQVAKDLVICYVIQPDNNNNNNSNNNNNNDDDNNNSNDTNNNSTDDNNDNNNSNVNFWNSPNCLKSFKIETVTIKRWISNKERNAADTN